MHYLQETVELLRIRDVRMVSGEAHQDPKTFTSLSGLSIAVTLNDQSLQIVRQHEGILAMDMIEVHAANTHIVGLYQSINFETPPPSKITDSSLSSDAKHFVYVSGYTVEVNYPQT